MNINERYAKEVKELEAAFLEIQEKVPELKLNSAKIKGEVAAAWQIENGTNQKLYIVLSGMAADKTDANADLIITFESDVGQFFDVDPESLKTFLEMNYSTLNQCRLGLTKDQRLVVLYRRWFENLSTKDAFDAISEVWNITNHLREQMKPVTPGHA